MNNNCKYLKQKLNRKLECKLEKNKIIPKDCANCVLKEYRCTELKKNCANYHFPDNRKSIKSPLKTGQFNTKLDYKMKQKSNELAKLERNRFSLFSTDKNKCYFCSSIYKLTWHEIYRGRNRSNSMKYGLCLRMCLSCHKKYQENKSFNDKWHKKGQILFNKTYPNLSFTNIFKINYLD